MFSVITRPITKYSAVLSTELHHSVTMMEMRPWPMNTEHIMIIKCLTILEFHRGLRRRTGASGEQKMVCPRVS